MFTRNLVTIAFLSMFSSAALAQELGSTLKAERNPPLKRTSIEIMPVESLISATPGVASGGASVETYIGKNFAVTASGTYADIDLPTKYVSSVNEKTGQPMVDSGYGYSAGAGLRYYNDPIGNSVYGAFGVDYSEARFGWKYDDEHYKSSRIAVTPGIGAGYRWVWQSGVLVRLGGSAGLPSISSKKVEAQTTGKKADEGERKVNDAIEQQVVAKIDFSVGMMF